MQELAGHVDVLGFGAAVLSAFGLMLRHVLHRSDKQADDYRRLVENHLTHNTEALIQLRTTLAKLDDTLQQHVK